MRENVEIYFKKFNKILYYWVNAQASRKGINKEIEETVELRMSGRYV